MSGGLGKTKMKASDFRFTRVRNWFGGDQTERVEGWKTYVYEAAGKMKAVNITKVRPRWIISPHAGELPPATFAVQCTLQWMITDCVHCLCVLY